LVLCHHICQLHAKLTRWFAAPLPILAIKTFALGGKSATEALKLLQETYKEGAFKCAYVFKLHKEYREGRESITNDRDKNPKVTVYMAENIKAVETIVRSDRQLTIDEIADQVGLSHSATHSILHNDLGVSKKSARCVPRLLTDVHKEQQLKMAMNFIKQSQRDQKAFFDSIVIVDETWVQFSTPELKSQLAQWLPIGSNPPKKAKVCGSEKKMMLITFFGCRGMVYQHFVKKGLSTASTTARS